MAAVEQAGIGTFARVTLQILAVLTETENAGVTVTVGDKDGAVRSRHGSRQAPFIRLFEARLRRSRDLKDRRAVDLHLYEEPVLLRRSLLHGGVEVFVAVLFGVDHGMYFGECRARSS